MLVPLRSAQSPPGAAERMSEPGAATSGFSRSDTGVGPPDEYSATVPGSSRFSTAPTVIADATLPGELTEPEPSSRNSFPAEATVGTPARAAPSIASATRSWLGSISASPSERLITSMPSATAASMPAAISGALPFGPAFVRTARTR